MIKTIGAIFILIGSLSIGYLPIHQMNLRMKCLMDYTQLLRKIRHDLYTNKPPLSLLFSRIKIPQTSSAISLLNKIQSALSSENAMSFREEWEKHISAESSLLTCEERESIKVVGEALGKYIIEEEILTIDNAITTLTDGYQTTKAILRDTSKLYISCSCAIGIILIIALI